MHNLDSRSRKTSSDTSSSHTIVVAAEIHVPKPDKHGSSDSGIDVSGGDGLTMALTQG